MIPYSVLDLAPVPQGASTAEALANTVSLARRAEALGYRRYWLAEHHNMVGIASAATAVLIGHVAGATERIRVGAGGIMLPNHSPLMVAEAFGTLATLYPDRIDLGLGRAPGTDMATARALRRGLSGGDSFPQDVVDLMGFLADAEEGQPVRAVPGAGTHVPLWMLGSSLFGAQLAAHLGLPYAFASHFAPAALDDALATYRRSYRPSQANPEPHFMLAVNVFAAETDAEGTRLRSSMQQAFLKLRRGTPGYLPPPVDDIADHASPAELEMVDQALKVSAVGSKDRVAAQFEALIARYAPDELILTGQIHDHDARLRSFGIAAEVLSA
ncbi:LLM class flavin-dependent oxidoreductase [Vannielia litorea]|nr:LLM class flavin-dependent oxidoreductase [Vannielia litorea]MBS8225540.1 LLM class flavin-dependent oxidoreductase [Vannielia litorea]